MEKRIASALRRRIGLGCWAIGGAFEDLGRPAGWGDVDDNESLRALQAGLEMGVEFLDTANIYGAGHSERIVGQAVRARREDVVICTKFGILCDEQTKKTTGLIETAQDIRTSCEDSLRRLQTDYIDILLFHVSDFPPEKAPMVLECLEQLVEEGKLRGYGWSTPDPQRAALFAQGEHCVGFEFPENVLEDDAAMLGLCERPPLSAICRTPLAMGLLTGKYNSETQFRPGDLRGKGGAPWMTYYHDGKPDEQMLERLAAIREILTSDGRTLAQGCLCWVLGRGEYTIPIPGFRTEKQVRENVAALEFGALKPQQMQQIEAILRG